MDGLHFLPDILAAAAVVVAEAAVPAFSVVVNDVVVDRWFLVLVESASQKEQKIPSKQFSPQFRFPFLSLSWQTSVIIF